MKKFVSLLLVLCLIGVVFAGCTAAPAATQEAAAPAEAEAAAAPATEEAAPAEAFSAETATGKYDGVDAPKGFKIGFAYQPPSDTLSAAFHKVLDYAAAEFGCEMLYYEWTSFDSEAVLAGYENLIQSGAQALIPIMVYGGLIDICNNKNVYMMPTCCETDPAVLDQAMASDYYLGNICEDEIVSGYQIAQCLYDAGSRKIALVAPAAGLAQSHDDRVRGVYQFADEHEDFEVVAESRDMFNTAVFDELIAAHGAKIDGIISTGGFATLPAAIIAGGYQDTIKYATIDIQGDVRTDLAEGMCAGVGGGQYPSMELAFVVCYNALASDGAKVITDRSAALKRPYMWMTTVEDYDNYIKYMEGDIPAYTGEELKDMTLAYNTEATVDSIYAQLVKYCQEYSLDEVITRHAALYE